MSDARDTPTEPVEPVDDDGAETAPPTDAAPAEDPVRTVTRKGAAVAMAACLVVGGLVGWVAATALDDDEARFDPARAFEERMEEGGRGAPWGPHAGGMGRFPGGGPWGGERGGPGPGGGWHEWDEGGRPAPQWEDPGRYDPDEQGDRDGAPDEDAPDPGED